MKYTEEQRKRYKIPVDNPEYKKDMIQEGIQQNIEDHYYKPEPDKYLVFESKLNTMQL